MGEMQTYIYIYIYFCYEAMQYGKNLKQCTPKLFCFFHAKKHPIPLNNNFGFKELVFNKENFLFLLKKLAFKLATRSPICSKEPHGI